MGKLGTTCLTYGCVEAVETGLAWRRSHFAKYEGVLCFGALFGFCSKLVCDGCLVSTMIMMNLMYMFVPLAHRFVRLNYS